MPIELTCSCGKRLRVADEFAGKPGQCPACGGMLRIPDRDATLTASSHESAPAPVADPGLAELFGPGWLENAVTPPAESAADLHDRERVGFKEDDNAKLTGVGCVLTLLTVAVIFSCGDTPRAMARPGDRTTAAAIHRDLCSLSGLSRILWNYLAVRNREKTT